MARTAQQSAQKPALDNKLADAQREGWLDGEAHAIGICFGDNPPWQYFETPEEQFEYDQARNRAFKSID